MKRIACVVFAVLALAAGACRAADEVNVQVVLKVTSGYLDQQRSVNSPHTVAGSPINAVGGTQSVTTNAAQLVGVGDVVVKGWSFWRNLATTNGGNVIALGVTNAAAFLEFARLSPGEYGVIPLGTNQIFAQSYGTNAAAILEKFVVEN